MLYVIRFNFFFFKQKTAYEMRISDWCSDVCSSDLRVSLWGKRGESLQPYLLKGVKVAISGEFETSEYEGETQLNIRANEVDIMSSRKDQIGRASCRERVCQNV